MRWAYAWWITHRLELFYSLVRTTKLVVTILYGVVTTFALILWHFIKGLFNLSEFRHHRKKN